MTQAQIVALLTEINEKYNLILQNAKTIAELNEQLTLVSESYIPVRIGGETKKMKIQAILDHIQQFAINQILNIGEITVDGNDITIPSGCQWQISGITYFTSTDTVIEIPFAAVGMTRIDIIVATTAGTLVKHSGFETDGVAVRPNIPLNTVLVTQINVAEDALDAVFLPLSEDELDAIHNANNPSGSNPFATMSDIVIGGIKPVKEVSAYDGDYSSIASDKTKVLMLTGEGNINFNYDQSLYAVTDELEILNRVDGTVTINPVSGSMEYLTLVIPPLSTAFIKKTGSTLSIVNYRLAGRQSINDTLKIGNEVTTEPQIFKLSATKRIVHDPADQSIKLFDDEIRTNPLYPVWTLNKDGFAMDLYDGYAGAGIKSDGYYWLGGGYALLSQDGGWYMTNGSINVVMSCVSGFTLTDNINTTQYLLGKISHNGIDYPAPSGPSSQIATMADLPVVNDRFKGKYTSLANLQAAHPTSNDGDYAVVDAGSGTNAKQYLWDSEEGWVPGSNTSPSTTDALPEGSTNLYWTNSRGLGLVLTGLTLLTGGTIGSSDTLIVALGKLQYQITNLLSETVLGSALAGFTAKNTLVDADGVVSFDSADSNKAKKTTWSNVWSNFLKSKADGLYLPKTTATTGSNIFFASPQIYNSPGSPSSSNLTNDLTGAQIGVVQKIYSNKSTEPTYPAGWVKLGTGSYVPSSLNIIYAEWVSGSRVEYWITQ